MGWGKERERSKKKERKRRGQRGKEREGERGKGRNSCESGEGRTAITREDKKSFQKVCYL